MRAISKSTRLLSGATSRHLRANSRYSSARAIRSGPHRSRRNPPMADLFLLSWAECRGGRGGGAFPPDIFDSPRSLAGRRIPLSSAMHDEPSGTHPPVTERPVALPPLLGAQMLQIESQIRNAYQHACAGPAKVVATPYERSDWLFVEARWFTPSSQPGVYAAA